MKMIGIFVRHVGNYAINIILFMLNCILFVLKSVLNIVLIILLVILLILSVIPIIPFILSILEATSGINLYEKLADSIDFDFEYYFCWHDYDGCKCRRCGKTRDESHDYDGCTCRKCGKEEHDFDGCVCRRCGKEHDLDSHCMCRICRKDFHDWQEVSREDKTEYMDTGSGNLNPVSWTAVTYRCINCGEERSEDTEVTYE